MSVAQTSSEEERSDRQRNDEDEREAPLSQISNARHDTQILSERPLASNGSEELRLKTVEVRLCQAFDHGSGESHGHCPKDVTYEAAFESDSNSNLESVTNKQKNSNCPEADDDLDNTEQGVDEDSATESEFFDCVEAEGDGHNFNTMRMVAQVQSLETTSKPAAKAPSPGTGLFENSFPAVHKYTQKNFVVNYAHLRRSGYFLERPNLLLPKEVPVGLITSNTKMTGPVMPPHVVEWVNNLPEDAPYLEDSEDDLMGKDEICEMTRGDLLTKHMTDEDRFKNMILEYGNVIKYTSKPVKPLTTSEVETVLEAATEAVDGYLEKMHKDGGHDRLEYVCGKVVFPSSWETENDTASKNSNRSSHMKKSSWFRNWLPLHCDVVGEGESCHDKMESGILQEEEERFQDAQIVLEPYHGPVFINGAVIEAGSTHPVINKGIFASIVEEIKAVLQAIHRALRRTDFPAQPPPVSPASSFYQTHPINEDPEIKQLTEMLQDKQQNKKTTERSVFGLRNLEKSPRYNLAFRRRLRLAQGQPRRSSKKFFRAINGWIQRDLHPSRPYIDNQFSTIRRLEDIQDNNNPNRIRSLQQVASESLPLPRPRPDYSPPKSNFLTSTVAHFVSAMKSMVPFQITPAPSPAIPASLAPNVQLGTRRRSGLDSHVRRDSSRSALAPIPTRYQTAKESSARQLRRNRNL